VEDDQYWAVLAVQLQVSWFTSGQLVQVPAWWNADGAAGVEVSCATMLCNSLMLGSRQSQCPAKHGEVFSVVRNVVNAVPSVSFVVPYDAPDQVYTLSMS